MSISKFFFLNIRNLVISDGTEIKEKRYNIHVNSPCYQYFRSDDAMVKFCKKTREN